MATTPLGALESAVRELCAQVRSYGWCTDARIIRDNDYSRYGGERVRVVFRMMDGQQCTHEINLTELVMEPDHVEAIFRNWRRNVILDLEAHHAPIATQMDRARQQQIALMQQQAQLGNYANQYANPYQQNALQGLQQWAQTQTVDPAIEERSKELFVSASGKPAYDTLNAGKPLALTGSKGGKYTLHKRSSFCVERTSDGARLCAVVPGVPLWDHLLGIKLMIEHDEPKFIKTANVSQGSIGMGLGAGAGVGGLGAIGQFIGGYLNV